MNLIYVSKFGGLFWNWLNKGLKKKPYWAINLKRACFALA
jgi:hypothetical protein